MLLFTGVLKIYCAEIYILTYFKQLLKVFYQVFICRLQIAMIIKYIAF